MVGNATKTLSEFLRRLTQEMADETLRDLSDPQLVEKAIAGCDVSVFQAIVLRHGTMVYGVCWRVLQHEHDAEDAFQATFLVLARKLSTVRKRASLASWLHGVARRIALKAQAQAAARRRHERQASVPEAVPADNPTPGEVRAVLDVELARLPEKWRLPLILCYLEGQTQDEAADHLGLSKGTLRNRLDQARRALASRLTQRGVVWPAVLSAVLLSDCMALAAPAPGLFASTVEAATGVAAGKTVAAAASVSVAALTEGVLKSMFLTKCKTAAAILLVLGAISFAGGLLTYHPAAAQQGPPEKSSAENQKGDADAPKKAAKAEVQTSPHADAIQLVIKTQQARIREVDREDWEHDTKERTWAVRRPFSPGTIDSRHLFNVSYRIDGKEVAAWLVDSAKGTVEPEDVKAKPPLPRLEKGARDAKEPEELAKVAALRFAKAFNEHSVEEMIRVAGLPFHFRPNGAPVGSRLQDPGPLVKTEKELRERLQQKVYGTLPDAIDQIVKYTDHRNKLLVSSDDLKVLDEVAGKGALVVYLTKKGKLGSVPIVVKLGQEQAKVVGFLMTWGEKDESGLGR